MIIRETDWVPSSAENTPGVACVGLKRIDADAQIKGWRERMVAGHYLEEEKKAKKGLTQKTICLSLTCATRAETAVQPEGLAKNSAFPRSCSSMARYVLFSEVSYFCS